MRAHDLNWRHVFLIARYHGRHSFRSGGAIVFAFLVMLVGLMIAQTFVGSFQALQANLEQQTGQKVDSEQLLQQMVQDIGMPAARWALGKDEAFASHMMENQPALLSVIFLMILFSLPFLVPLGGFNQFSGDIQSRGLRYILTRTARINIYAGRFLGTYLFSALVLTLLIGVIVLFALLKMDVYGWKEILPLACGAALASVALALPLVAMSSWISARIASPFLSLLVLNALVTLVPLTAAIGANYWKPLSWIAWTIPWGVKFQLLHPAWGMKLAAYGACVLYAALFFFAGYRVFSRRDL